MYVAIKKPCIKIKPTHVGLYVWQCLYKNKLIKNEQKIYRVSKKCHGIW